MKRLIFLAILLVMAVGLRAQQTQVATLLHNGEITVFYNADGLEKAYAASVDGDVITLSSGQFNAVNLNKNITVRGAGMGVKDADGNTTATTILSGDFTVGAKDTVGNCLTLEGLQHNGTMAFGRFIKGVNFYKCYFNKIDDKLGPGSFYTTRKYQHLTFLHCNINVFDLNIGGGDASIHSVDINFINSTLLAAGLPLYDNNEDRSCSFTFTNCIICPPSSTYLNLSLHHCMMSNSIIINNNSERNLPSLDATSMAYNCIALSQNQKDNNPFVNGSANGNNTFIETYYSNPFVEGTFYNLIDALKVYKGTDGKEVGIHGGSLPFSPRTSNPQIVKFDVAPRTTRDGKLSVDIEVSSDQ